MSSRGQNEHKKEGEKKKEENQQYIEKKQIQYVLHPKQPFDSFYFENCTKIYDVLTTEAVLQQNTCKSEPNIINLERPEPVITLSPTHQSWVLRKVKKDMRGRDTKGQKKQEVKRNSRDIALQAIKVEKILYEMTR